VTSTNPPPGAKALLVRIFEEAVREVRPDRLLADGSWVKDCARPIGSYGRVVLVSIGKAAIPFAVAVERTLGDRLYGGLAVVPHGYAEHRPADLDLPRRVRVIEAGHPVPDRDGVEASRAVLRLVGGAGADDLVIACLSGGGSALLPAPPADVPIGSIRDLTRSLLRSGAPIHEVNTVRRALSRIAGGGLARAAAPAEVVGLVLSDVPGDDLAVVSGGPLAASPTTADDALAVLSTRGVEAPPEIVRHLRAAAGRKEEEEEVRATARLVGSNADLLRAAALVAGRLGIPATTHGDLLLGESREAGARVVRAALSAQVPSGIHLWGGETTVRVTGQGTGGRNQELALGAAVELHAMRGDCPVLSAGSDGIDGPTRAAGAVCDGRTVALGRERGLDAGRLLDENDSNRFFAGTGGLVVTGPTHTNVMDLVAVLRSGAP
jgi:hydroxypyruvate reductase